MREYVIGVDGGGTKTDCVLLDVDGNLIDSIKWGTTSHEFLEGGFAEFETEITQLIENLLNKNHLQPSNIKKAVFGMAGVDTKYQQHKEYEIIAKTGLKDFIVCNDGFLGIKAGTVNGVGMTVINGTGCSFTGINRTGNSMQIGGQAVVMDDVGGGHIIGRNIVRMVHEELYLHGKPTLLTQLLMQKIGVTDRNCFMDELVRQVDDQTIEIKHIAYMVFEAACRQDEVAAAYLKKMGKDIARYILAVIDELKLYEEEQVEVVLIGSVFIKSATDIHIKKMLEIVHQEHENVVLKPLMVKPVCGAALWALDGCKFCKDSVIKQIQERSKNS
ncbi:MAG: BadF/BadG/BcrA/BcrD ATPase family protein [Christensenellaceae bacterium]